MSSPVCSKSTFCARARNNAAKKHLTPSIGPRERRLKFDPVQEQPKFEDFFTNIEKLIAKYEDLLMEKLYLSNSILLGEITATLEPIDGVRCFFAALFLARAQKVDLEQTGEDIRITLTKQDKPNSA